MSARWQGGNASPPWERERAVREIGFRTSAVQSLLAELAPGAGRDGEPPRRRERYDCIVVGAGPAGATAAYFLARAGLDVLLLERGPAPGSKNVGGGALYAQTMEPLFPGFWREAPLEGAIVRQSFHVMTEEAALSVAVDNGAFARPPYNRFAVLKARFDPWLARQAERAGARLLVNHTVEELLLEDGRVVGVAASAPLRRRFLAPVTVIAEGAWSLLAARSGLIPKAKADDMALYVKEVIALPPAVIRRRFGLAPGQAAVLGFLGYPTAYLRGTASLYTYRDALGINAGSLLTDLRQARIQPASFLERLKKHPFIRPLIAGGRVVEYTAHLIPDGGYHRIPELVHDGALLVGDAAGLVNGTHGINNAALSGKFAAEAVVEAHRRGDFSARTLRLYRDLLAESHVMKDLRANARVPGFYARHPDVFNTYPKLLNELAYQVAMVYPMPKREKRALLWREVRAVQPLVKTLNDLLNALQVMR